MAEWRSSHPRRSPLPEEFWAAAVQLARKHGLYRTARALPIDYANLRKRLNQRCPARNRQPSALSGIVSHACAHPRLRRDRAGPAEFGRGLEPTAAGLAAKRMIQITPQMTCWWRWSPLISGKASTDSPSCAGKSSRPIHSRDGCSCFAAAGPSPFVFWFMTAKGSGWRTSGSAKAGSPGGPPPDPPFRRFAQHRGQPSQDGVTNSVRQCDFSPSAKMAFFFAHLCRFDFHATREMCHLSRPWAVTTH